jgi:hypothetical protein
LPEISRLFPAYRFNLPPVSGFITNDRSNRPPTLLFFTNFMQTFPSVVRLARQLFLEKPGYTQNSTRFNESIYSYVTASYLP